MTSGLEISVMERKMENWTGASDEAQKQLTRRSVLIGGALLAAATQLPASAFASETNPSELDLDNMQQGGMQMSFVTTRDGVEIFYKDWGKGQPIVFHHGWPLSSDDWDTQMLFFLQHGYRVIGIDRRGHGRSSQVSEGHDMDHYAADAAAVVEHLDLHDAIHIGHSTGGGEAARYVARHGKGRVSKLVLVASVPPLMVKTKDNPGGLDISVLDGMRAALAANRSQFFVDLPTGPFYGFNRPENKPIQGVIDNWWRQGMMGSAKAHYEGIKAFSETDQTEDLKAIGVPTLVLAGDDDQIVPYKDGAELQAKLLKKPTVKIYPGYAHGMLTTHADILNPEILGFIKG
jgi:non-heme chloroperoxidase